MKENWKIKTCDWLALETSLGFQLTMHVQKSPWILDVGHVDNLDEGKLLYWLRLDWIN